MDGHQREITSEPVPLPVVKNDRTMPTMEDDATRLKLSPSPSIVSSEAGPAHNASSGIARKDSDIFDNSRPLTKSNSILSHMSIPFTGAIPLGNLRVVRPADSIMEAEDKETNNQDLDIKNVRTHERPKPQETPPCLRNADAFLVLGLSEQFQIGCDSLAITVQKDQEPSAFVGFGGIPPGTHFVWISPPGSMERQGYWFLTNPGSGVARIKQWDRYREVLGECASQYEARSLAQDIESLCPILVPYRGHSGPTKPLPNPPVKDSERWSNAIGNAPDIWKNLTSCITGQLLGRVTGRKVSGGRPEWLVATADTPKDGMALTGSAEFVFLFSRDEIDPYRLLAANAANTKASQDNTVQPIDFDSTQAIISLLEHSPAGYTEDDIVGELQFLFLTGILLSNLSCLEQWWYLVLKVILRARRLVACRPGLCRVLLQTMHMQFVYLDRHVSGGFAGGTATAEDGGAGIFDAKPHGEARLRAALITYKRRLNDVLLGLGNSATPEEAAVGQAFADLEAWLWKYGWDLRSDYVPGPDDADTDDDTDGSDGGDEDSRRNSKGSRWQLTPSASRESASLYDSDDSEDQPVLVELDEAGREVGLVTWD